MKTCTDCQQKKELTEFGTSKNGQGRTYTYGACRPCCAARSAKQRAVERAKWSLTAEITALIQATTSRRTTTPPPLPTREQMWSWYYDEECRI